jgi:hypothetical protein
MASASEEPYEAEEHAINEAEDHAVYLEEQPKKKKRINELRDWIEVERRNRSDHSDQDIKVFIRAVLDALNLDACIMHLPGAHKDRNMSTVIFNFVAIG